ncbi:deoxyribodipyrimidine photo-lyase [Shewanella sp. WXL01]|uniref:cryptochrome/photolyase family protein n=1 Tax=Shewanella sp. WXL01 TaxID=2709721 RepID=UPI0014383938|nr:FAD-binding domain-containing protein [Shewanella sp. WXL01]NKF49836.1 deoxyribodipyrimidine photo-lyase [Shewanella sp. WXL01]
MNSLIWFRQDLRLADNKAFYQACSDIRSRNTATVVDAKTATVTEANAASTAQLRATYIVTPKQWLAHDVGAMQIDFIERHVNLLGENLAKLGIELDVLTCDDFDGVDELLLAYVAQHDIKAIYASSELEHNERQRDARLHALLESKSISLNLFEQHCAITPGSVANLSGDMYKVFTPFSKQWRAKAMSESFTPLPVPEVIHGCEQGSQVAYEPVRFELGDSYIERVSSEQWSAGEEAASERLNQFIEGHISQYSAKRDIPAIDGTSSLSPYLALGVLSPRQCIAAVLFYYPDALVNETSVCKTWINELIWREFYRHLLAAFPRLSKNANFNVLGDGIEWRNDADEFAAWCEGRTGYPIVDAAMRQLNQTGWMHNRLRMIVASFLTKHLLVDWRWGERYFRQKLIDGDLAANNGGWQWSAGTGCDAQPYFRVFNPYLQSEKFDPQAIFIKRFVPELNNVAPKLLHKPPSGGGYLGNTHSKSESQAKYNEPRVIDMFADVNVSASANMSDTSGVNASGEQAQAVCYPSPIVEHSFARTRAIEVLAALKKS